MMEDDAVMMKEKLKKLLVPMSPAELYTLYSNWCEDYENDMPTCRYMAPFKTAECFLELKVPKDKRILDIGAGTGWLGQALHQNGYQNIDALDANDKMLEKAKMVKNKVHDLMITNNNCNCIKQKSVYHEYIQAYISPSKKLPIPEQTYDVVVMTGVFVPGHLPIHQDTFRQILRVLKKGGTLAWSMPNPYRFKDCDESFRDNRFDKILQNLVESKDFEILEGYPKTFSDYFKDEDGIFYATKKL